MPTRGCGSRPRRFATTPPSRSDAPPTPGVPSNAGPSTCSSSALVDDDVAHGCRRPGGAPMAFCSSAVGCSSRMSRWLSVQRASALTAVAAHDDRRTVLHVVDVAVELRLQFLGGDRSSCCGGRRRAGRPPRARRFGDVPPLEVGRGAGGRKPAVRLVDTETDDRITGFRRGRRLQAADGGRAAADQAADVGPIPEGLGADPGKQQSGDDAAWWGAWRC